MTLLAVPYTSAGGSHLEVSTSEDLRVSHRVLTGKRTKVVQYMHSGERRVEVGVRTARVRHPQRMRRFRIHGEGAFRTPFRNRPYPR